MTGLLDVEITGVDLDDGMVLDDVNKVSLEVLVIAVELSMVTLTVADEILDVCFVVVVDILLEVVIG